MYSLSTFCCVCLHDGEDLQSLNEKDFDNVQLLSKLKFCALQNDEWIINDVAIYICIQCCHILRLAYNFKKMCIKNNYFIRGYVSKLRSVDCATSEKSKNVSLQKLKDYVDNMPLSEYIKPTDDSNLLVHSENNQLPEKEISPKIKKENEQPLQIIEPEIFNSTFEPQISIEENEIPIKIDIEENEIPIKIDINDHPLILQKQLKKPHQKVKRKCSRTELPLLYNNDFQEKSSTRTLELLKNLVCGTKSAAVDKLKQLVSEPIPEGNQLNHEFQAPEVASDADMNNFETIYVKPEPSDNFDLETSETQVSDTETEKANSPPISEEVLKLLDRDDNFCHICNKTFICKSYYERHITMHTGIKNYQCDICKKRFTRKSTLKTHYTAHTGEATFACPICKQIFTQKGNMKIHLLKHCPKKSHPCCECDKSFILKTDLKVHLMKHENARKSQCPICRQRFLKPYFAIHLASHKEFR